MDIEKAFAEVRQRSLPRLRSSKQFSSRKMIDGLPKIKKEDLTLGKVLGRGNFGVVLKVKKLGNSTIFREDQAMGSKSVVVKTVSDEILRGACPNDDASRQLLSHAASDIMNEAHILSSLRHPNVISLRAISTTHDLLIVDRLVETLVDRMQYWRKVTKNQKLMPWPTAQRQTHLYQKQLEVAGDLASALEYLHGQHIMHRDLKPENIGFDAAGTLKVFDFGLSRVFDNSKTPYLYTAATGTARYMAPENFMGSQYDERTDIYSFGMVLWEVLHLKRPFEGYTVKIFRELVCKRSHRPEMDQKRISPRVQAVIRECWSSNPDNRPTAHALKHSIDAILSSLGRNGDSSLSAMDSLMRRRSSCHERRPSLLTVATSGSSNI